MDSKGLLVVAFVDAGPMLVGTFPNSDEADTACQAFLLMYPNVQFSELEMPSPVEKTRLGNWSSYSANQADWLNHA